MEIHICVLCGLEVAGDEPHDCDAEYDDERTIPGWTPTGKPRERALAIIPLKKIPRDRDPDS